MNNKKEGEYYSQMVRRYKNEYGGENLQEFCIKEKVSYTKMLHCLRNESYRKPQQQAEAQVDGPGLRHISWESFVYLLEGIVLRDRKVPFCEVELADDTLNTPEDEIIHEA